MIRLRPDELQLAIERSFLDVGVVPEAAAHVAASVCETSLRGVDSHGIHLVPHYHRAVAAGRIKRAPEMAVERDAATARLAADHAFGHHAGARAVELAIELAQTHGTGAVAVADSTHFGAAGYFALLGARRGYMSFAFTNADALVKVPGAPGAFFGTNPVCCAAPLAGEDPFCLDMATSLVSWNKLKNKAEAGEELPEGWAYDGAGRPTLIAADARSLAPIGDYKGFGLGMLVDVLCGMLAGGPVGDELAAMYTTPIATRRHISHFFMCFDLERFGGADPFAQRMASIAERIRGLSSDFGEVMVPGDPEKRTATERAAAGIPIAEARWDEFLAIDERFGAVAK